jgi:3-dehydroquinate synthase
MKIKSYRGEYEVVFTNDFVNSLNEEIQERDIFLVDEQVDRIYADRLAEFRHSHSFIVLPSGEKTKSFEAAGKLIDKLMQMSFKRNHRLVAVGGGIVQDAVAFVASILFRGVDWYFVPTTLLAQGDSCIGSKTSVNFGDCKNLLGGFHPPSKVFVDPEFLSSLEEREIRSGLGEMLHFFMISGSEDFAFFRKNFHKCLADPLQTNALTCRSLEIKKAMIEMDEFDQGPRKVFNYGHTFGHALEGITDYTIPHGLAVCYGMDLANHVSVHLGFLDLSVCLLCKEFLALVWQGFEFPKIQTSLYLKLLTKDKKNVGNKLNLILTRGLGDMFMFQVEPDEALVEVIEQCLKSYSLENLCSK